MKEIYVNLKRFDIPKTYGGICPDEDPVRWIRKIVKDTAELGLGNRKDVQVTYFLPESLLVPALEELRSVPEAERSHFQIGCQGVYREDVAREGNFGAFTVNRPAAAMKALGQNWVMIGHSEERKDKLSLLSAYDSVIDQSAEKRRKAEKSVDEILNQEVRCALERNMNVLFCVGETAEQKGAGPAAEYEPRVQNVLRDQICTGLKDIGPWMEDCQIAIGYEPVWAIGPGKTPPDGEYVAFVSRYIKEVCKEEFHREFSVVYGGGLKEENAAEMAAVSTLDGGLVALTKFTPPIAFDVRSLKEIIKAYVK